MSLRSPNTPASLSRRAGAQRRIRRSMGPRPLFCGTNGCTTYLVAEPDGQRAVCPICGYRRSLPAAALASASHGAPAPRAGVALLVG